MADKNFIVMDLGSSNIRCALINADGKISKMETQPIQANFPKPNHAEYDGEKLLNIQLELLNGILKESKPAGIGISSQRSTIVLWDKNTGKPLCPVLSWQDGRGAQELGKVSLSQEEIHKITGLYKTPYYSASKISWCLKNYPEVQAAYKKGNLFIGALPTYLIWHLTGGKTFAIDPTLAQRTLLFDINKFDWSSELLKLFEIDKNILPQIKSSTGDFGTYKDIPIIAMAGDQQSAQLGAGAVNEGEAVLNYGSGAFLLINTGGKILSVNGILNSVNCQIGNAKPAYSLEGTVNSAGTMFDWLKKLGLDFDIKKLDDYCKNASTNPILLPALGGLGAPFWDFNTNVTMAGLTPQSKKEDIIKASLQGVAFLAAIIAMQSKKHGLVLKEVRSSGGLANSDYLLGFQADLLQASVVRMGQVQMSITGIGYIMARHLGLNTDNWNFLENSVKFNPKLSPSQSEKLVDCYYKFLELSRQISKI
jgi:glycerol kinase